MKPKHIVSLKAKRPRPNRWLRARKRMRKILCR